MPNLEYLEKRIAFLEAEKQDAEAQIANTYERIERAEVERRAESGMSNYHKWNSILNGLERELDFLKARITKCEAELATKRRRRDNALRQQEERQNQQVEPNEPPAEQPQAPGEPVATEPEKPVVPEEPPQRPEPQHIPVAPEFSAAIKKCVAGTHEQLTLKEMEALNTFLDAQQNQPLDASERRLLAIVTEAMEEIAPRLRAMLS